MIVCGYSLELYCDYHNPEHEYKEFPVIITHELGSKCRKAARRAGWTLKKGLAKCPKCTKARITEIGNTTGDIYGA